MGVPATSQSQSLVFAERTHVHIFRRQHEPEYIYVVSKYVI